MSAHAAKPGSSRQEAAFAAASASTRIIDLLARYPHVSGAEAAEIADYLKKARYVEVERIRTDDSLRDQLDLFISKHRHALRPSAVDIVSMVAITIAFLAICWLLAQSVGAGAPA